MVFPNQLWTPEPGNVYVHFFFFLAALSVLWDPSSLTRDGTWAPAVEAWSPNHWAAREVPLCAYLYV